MLSVRRLFLAAAVCLALCGTAFSIPSKIGVISSVRFPQAHPQSIQNAATDASPTPNDFHLFTDPDPMNCSCTDLTTCQEALAAAEEDPCHSSADVQYSTGFHIGAIFAVLAASVLGAGIPLLIKYVPALGIPYFVLVCGKCAGIGVVLAAALVHMILPAQESLTSPCLPPAFTEEYTAYAFMFAMVAAIVMQFIDFTAEQYLLNNMKNSAIAEQHQAMTSDSAATAGSVLPATATPAPLTISTSDPTNQGAMSNQDLTLVDHPQTPKYQTVSAKVNCKPGHEGHVHSILLTQKVRATLSAYLLEFGITIHSVFIGLQNGVVSDEELKTLLIALCFHQFFEGVALGSRLIDAELPSRWHEFIFSIIFSISAPIGIMIGVILTVSLSLEGQTYLLTQGVLDGVCGGILLFIGFQLLIRDLPQDMKDHCSDKHDHPGRRRAAMFLCLWTGAGLMAFIGRYL